MLMTNLKNARGFTLVELMIVVAIIGILASVGGVYFKTYQVKSRITEAKIQLSSVYTSQKIFYNEFDMYSNCLSDMGFVPVAGSKRYYAIGFPSITAAIDTNVYNQAVSNGLVAGGCPATLAPSLDRTFFLASNGAGSQVMDTLAKFQGAIPSTSNALDSGGVTSRDVEEGLGNMLSGATQQFTAAAAGFVSTNSITPATSSLITIDQEKHITIVRQGD